MSVHSHYGLFLIVDVIMNLMYAVRSSLFYQLRKLWKAKYAQWIWWKPWEALEIIGVTWTDWKTSTCTVLSHMLHSLGYSVMMIWTNGVFVDGKEQQWVQKMTSYDPLDLQRLLANAVDQWVSHVVMEVSSHGLDQQRFEWVGILLEISTVLSSCTPQNLKFDFFPLKN